MPTSRARYRQILLPQAQNSVHSPHYIVCNYNIPIAVEYMWGNRINAKSLQITERSARFFYWLWLLQLGLQHCWDMLLCNSELNLT